MTLFLGIMIALATAGIGILIIGLLFYGIYKVFGKKLW